MYCEVIHTGAVYLEIFAVCLKSGPMYHWRNLNSAVWPIFMAMKGSGFCCKFMRRSNRSLCRGDKNMTILGHETVADRLKLLT